jgi:putative endonuclease
VSRKKNTFQIIILLVVKIIVKSRLKKNIGDWGESQACAFLIRKGFKIIERNFFSTQGEIDIIAKKQGDYYFIEVKTRQIGALATDLAITREKKYKFHKTVKHYCYTRDITNSSLIFAGLLVVFNRITKQIKFRLVVFID